MDNLIDVMGLEELLPESISHDEQIETTVKAISLMVKDIIGKRGVPSLYMRFDVLESAQLDHLAAMFDITTWRDSWPVEIKRSVIRMMFEQKSRIGTLSSVRASLESLGSALSITEWWQTEPKGTPHTFTVDATLSSFEGVLSSELQEDIMSLLDESKPARALYTFNIRAAEQGGFGFTAVARSLSLRRLKNF